MTKRYFIAWLVLSIATLLNWWLDVSLDAAWVGTVVLLVAFFKARLVLMIFMEVKEAPTAVRWCCEAWVIVACTAVTGTYWFAPLA